MTSYTVVDVKPDTPAWEAERRNSLGASDVPNVLNLPGSYGTPLEVYRSKMGVDRDFPEMLGWVGHKQEAIMQEWLEEFHPELGPISPGLMARSIEHPWLHASFDRMAGGVPIQMKTVIAWQVKEWKDGPPVAVQAQVQAEMYVAGTDHAYLVSFLGGRDFTLDRLTRDGGWIETMLDRCGTFWHEHVLTKIPPEPVMSSEAVELWPGDDGEIFEIDGELAKEWNDIHARHRELEDEITAAKDELQSVDLIIQKAMKNATVIRANGFDLFTWKTKKGARRIDTKQLRKECPDIAEQFTIEGPPTRIFQRVKGPTND